MSSQGTFIYDMMPPTQKIVGRERDLAMLEQVLHKRRMRNCILVGEPGVGKTELVREVARKHRDIAVFRELSIGSLTAGTDYRGDFEAKLINAIDMECSLQRSDEKRRTRVLFIDEIHTIMEAGSVDGRDTTLTAANILKPYLSSGRIVVWGATTPREYFRSLANDGAISRRMPPVFISELDRDAVRKIVTNFSSGDLSRVQVEDILDATYAIPGAHQPDAAIEMADRLLASIAMGEPQPISEIADSMGRQYELLEKAKNENR